MVSAIFIWPVFFHGCAVIYIVEICFSINVGNLDDYIFQLMNMTNHALVKDFCKEFVFNIFHFT